MIGAPLALMELVGLASAMLAITTHRYVWSATLRVVLALNTIAVPFLVLIVYLSLFAFNLTLNGFGFLLLPTVFLYFMAMRAVFMSDIWPLSGGKNTMWSFEVPVRLAPVSLLSLLFLGIAMFTVGDIEGDPNGSGRRFTGLVLVVVASLFLLTTSAIGLLVFFNDLQGGLNDVILSAIPRDLFKSFGDEGGDEDEEEDGKGDVAPTGDLDGGGGQMVASNV